MVLRAQVMRLNPTPEQEAYFYRAAGISRFVWNWALAEYKAIKAKGEKVDWNALQKQFNARKHEDFPFVTEVTKSAAQVAFMDLRQTIGTYYKTKKTTRKSKRRFPGFRKRHKKVGGFGLQNDVFKLNGHTVTVPKLGDVNISHPLRFGSSARILSGRIKYQAGRWYLSVVLKLSIQPAGTTSGSVGIDFGLSKFATLSNGTVYETQGHYRKAERKLKLHQRALSRKKLRSQRRAKQKLKVARWHKRVANQRKDFLHKMTTAVACAYSIVCIEDLCLNGMAQSSLAKSVHDAGIGEAVRQLGYKSTFLQKVGRFFPSSKRCHVCGYINHELTLSDRMWTCPQCGTKHSRDLNAALNIELEGVSLLAGSGYLGVTPVELATSTPYPLGRREGYPHDTTRGVGQAAGCETGNFP